MTLSRRPWLCCCAEERVKKKEAGRLLRKKAMAERRGSVSSKYLPESEKTFSTVSLNPPSAEGP
jgi:hypothetical protein